MTLKAMIRFFLLLCCQLVSADQASHRYHRVARTHEFILPSNIEFVIVSAVRRRANDDEELETTNRSIDRSRSIWVWVCDSIRPLYRSSRAINCSADGYTGSPCAPRNLEKTCSNLYKAMSSCRHLLLNLRVFCWPPLRYLDQHSGLVIEL
jgi:hypothetical protein